MNGDAIHVVNYSLVTCDMADSGVFAALIIATLFCWRTQVGYGLHDGDVRNQLTPE